MKVVDAVQCDRGVKKFYVQLVPFILLRPPSTVLVMVNSNDSHYGLQIWEGVKAVEQDDVYGQNNKKVERTRSDSDAKPFLL